MSLQDPATVSAIAARLMRGHDIRMARIGILRSSSTPARQEDGQIWPPFVDIVLDTKPNLAESEPPVTVDFLSRQIREKLAEGQPVTVDGLGTFEQDVEGLVFHADERLRHSVNAEWGHLEPHNLPAPPVLATPPESSADPVPAAEPTFDGDPELESIGEWDVEPVLESGPVSTTEPQSNPGTEPAPEPESSREAPSRPVPEWKELATTEDTAAPKKRRTAASARLDRKREASRMPVWLMIAGALVPVLVVVLGVLLWPDASNPNPGSTDSVPADTLQTTADTGDTATGTDDNQAEGTNPMASSSADSAIVAPVEPAPASTFALSRGMPGYTLILASGINERSAVALARTFDDLGLPYGVLTYPSDTGTLNRLALGQWPTVAEADSMRTVLAARLPEGTWVKRLD